MTEERQRRGDDGRYHKVARAGAPLLNMAGVVVAIPLVIWMVDSYRDDYKQVQDDFKQVIEAVQTLTVTLATTVNEQTNVKGGLQKLQNDVESLQQIVWGRAGDDH